MARPAGRRPGTDSPPGPSGRVQPAKFLLQGRAPVPVLRTGRLCCPGGAGTSLLPLLQGGTVAPRPFLSAFPVAPARHVNARAPRAPWGNRSTGRRLPWRPPCFAPGAGGCGRLRDALTSSLALRARAAHFQSRRRRERRYSLAACAPGLPPHALPPARVMRAPPAHWLGPARAAGARVIPMASALLPGRARIWGRWTGPAHVTPAPLSSSGDFCGGAEGGWRGASLSLGIRWPHEGSCWLRLLLGAAPGPSRPTGGAHSLGKLRTTLGAVCSQVFPFKGAPLCYKESRSVD